MAVSLDLPIRDADTARLSKEVKRPDDLGSCLVIDAGRLVLLREGDRRIRPQPSLNPKTACDIQLGAGCAERGFLLERLGDRKVELQTRHGVHISRGRTARLTRWVRLRVGSRSEGNAAD